MAEAEKPMIHDQIYGTELNTRHDVFIVAHLIGAVMALGDGGPTRLFFAAGGHIDVCGSAEIWRSEIEIARLHKITEGREQ